MKGAKMRKNTVLIFLFLLFGREAFSGGLPWPAVILDRLCLPFALEWFTDGDRSRSSVQGYGEPVLAGSHAFWRHSVPEGTVFVEQVYHQNSLVGLRMEYILVKEPGLMYKEKVRYLRESMREWVFNDLRSFPEGLGTMIDEFSAEDRDSRIRVKWREGEHSVFITIEMQAR
jgi:hypothetical protein